MDLKLTIDKSSDIPIYIQIANHIENLVNQGVLKAGEKLPPERDIAASNGISRGTIKKAYEELEKRNAIQSIQGSGSFIEGAKPAETESRKDRAMMLIDEMLSGMEKLGFTYEEIKIYLNIRLRQIGEEAVPVRIAAVDCNPEALAIFSRQLSNIPNIEIKSALLENIDKGSNSLDFLEEFDLILTTTTHFEHLINLFPTLKDKIIKCAVSASRKTVVELARIEANSHVGIFFESQKFAGIVKGHLDGIGVECNISFIQGNKEKISLHSLDGYDTIIVPPYYFMNRPRQELDFIVAFKQSGGRIINFEYLIDRGSVLYIEDRLKDIKKRWQHGL